MKNLLIVIFAVLVLLGGGYFIRNKKVSTPTTETPSSKVTKSVPTDNFRGETLNLSGQGLTKAPSDIFDNTNLSELDLSRNNLDGALPSQVGQLTNLRILDLSDNKFTGVPAEVGQLKNLEVLDLSNNLLTGLPNELGNLKNLKLLDLSGNNYSEMDLAGIRKNLPGTTVIKTK